jgi:hypothetical protein
MGMFGQQDDHKNDQDQQNTAQIPDQSIEGVLNDDQATPTPTEPDTQAPAWQHPGLPLSDSTDDDTTATPVIAPTTSMPASPAPASDASATDVPEDLIDIKQQALNQLTPLVGHLDQSPEERFRTTMMMIQASDNQSLIKDAYAAAQAITDEKIRAQALLDIVNEINYFTQSQEA